MSFSNPPVILCIDDHLSGLVGRKALLEQCGYRVLSAMGGPEGLSLFRSNSVTAVIVDYHMPGMSGDIVAAKMKNIRSEVPIMMLSAYVPPRKSKLKGIDQFLSKSESPANFIAAVKVMLQNRSRPTFGRWLRDWKNRLAHNLVSSRGTSTH